MSHKEVKPLIDETFSVLKEAIDTGIKTEIPAVMLNKLQQDVFLFSGMKTYTQLKEASLLLRDEAGKIKSEAKFISDIKKIDSSYNENYLRAERQYAIAASQSAAQYHEYMQDADRYDLQIRTAADDKVRAAHAALHNVTRPADDSYWNNVWTPFDWGCRCRIIQVIKGKYTVTDIDTAKEASNKAVPALFRFNPGKQQIIFPPKHPYYPQHCNGEKLNLTGLIGFAKWLLDAEGDRCKAMQVVKRMKNAETTTIVKSYKNGGKILKPSLVDTKASDYGDVVKCCDFFAKNGKTVTILPKANRTSPDYDKYFKELIGTKYEGKCPDFKIGKKYYELEGYSTGNLDKAVSNMLKRGLKQSSRIIIEDSGTDFRSIRKTVFYRKKGGVIIDEVWIKRKDGSLVQVI